MKLSRGVLKQFNLPLLTILYGNESLDRIDIGIEFGLSRWFHASYSAENSNILCHKADIPDF